MYQYLIETYIQFLSEKKPSNDQLSLPPKYDKYVVSMVS